MTDKEMEAVPPKSSSSADGATGMDRLTPEGLHAGDDSHIYGRIGRKQSLARRESTPVDPHASAGTSSSGKSKVIREVTTSRMRRGRERTAIRLVRGLLCVEAGRSHLYR